MYISKSVLLGLLVAAAGVLGWVLHELTADTREAAEARPAAALRSTEQPSAAGEGGDGGDGDTIVNVIVPAGTGTGTAASPSTAAVTVGTAGTAGAPGTAAGGDRSTDTPVIDANRAADRRTSGARYDRRASETAPRPAAAAAFVPAGGSVAGAVHSASAAAPAGLSLTIDPGQGAAGPPGASVTAVGSHIVIAYDDSIVFVGDDGRLTANTGDASSSATVALDVSGSDLASGDSVTSQPSTAPSTSSSAVAGEDVAARSTNGTLDLSQAPGRAVSISGFEDHSIEVVGTNNVATYDDSNVFIARDGQINANTGDTDSSGLNVVDVSRSVVRSGAHTEEGGDDDEEPEEPEEEEVGTPAASALPASDGGPSTAAAAPPAVPAAPRATASVADEGDTSASGDSALAIGADGYDDLALDVAGHGNVATYDDSNAVIGGSGDVNAQIGDSDTSGTVVMGVDDSLVESGPST